MSSVVLRGGWPLPLSLATAVVMDRLDVPELGLAERTTGGVTGPLVERGGGEAELLLGRADNARALLIGSVFSRVPLEPLNNVLAQDVGHGDHLLYGVLVWPP